MGDLIGSDEGGTLFNIPMKPIDIQYRTAEKFFQDYLQLKEGELFVQAENPVPDNTRLVLELSVPGINHAFQVIGIVIKTRDLETAAQLGKPPGMLVRVENDLEKIFQELEPKLMANEKYQLLLALCETVEASDPIIGNDAFAEELVADDVKSPAASQEPSTSESHPAPSESPTEPPPQSEISAKPASDKQVDRTKAKTEQPKETDARPETPADQPPPPSGAPDGNEAPVTDDAETKNSAKETDAELTFEWLRKAVAQEKAVVEEVPAPEVAAPSTQDKKNLTPQEREKIKPAADFIMDLTKAMLRTGYYSPDHPGSKKAKIGLYKEFQNCLGDSDEIMITNLESRGKTDILITGILDEPVSVRTLVGAGMAELFVPKMRDYFNRKGLVSFAIKKRITAPHFESYVDIMSDPKADRGENTKVGELLSKALAEQGITEISTIFMDDIIVLEKNLPWRVEMAIQRLAKDLKLMPMFRQKSNDAILKLKLNIIYDIIRPLKYGQYLKELLVNCYIISQHVEDIEAEEIEAGIIEALPAELLLSTSQHVLEELNHLNDLKSKESPTAALNRRLDSVKRIIKCLSLRMISLKVKGAQSFLEELHHSHILAFEELPLDVQYLVNTIKMVRDIQARTKVYITWIFQRQNPDDATVLLKCFRRVMPVLFEQESWDLSFTLTMAVDAVRSKTDLYSSKNNLPSNPFYFMFKDVSEELVCAYQSLPPASRSQIDQIVRRLDRKGMDILNQIITTCENPDIRMEAMTTIKSMDEMARRWSLKALKANQKEDGKVKNALAILRDVGNADEDTGIIKTFTADSDPRVREEALHTLMHFKAGDLEPIIVEALNHTDDKLRWRAMKGLSKLNKLSEGAIRKILMIIKSDPPEDKQQALIHASQISQLIQTVGALNNLATPDLLEDAILEAAQKAYGVNKRFKGWLKKQNPKADHTTVLFAAVATLGKIGSSKSVEFLAKFNKGKSDLAQEAGKALDAIKLRKPPSEQIPAAHP